MKIGVRAHDFSRKDERSLAKEIKEAGFQCVQLALTKAISDITSFDMITDKRVYEIGEAFSKEGLEISVLGCYIEPSITDNEARLKNVQNFCICLRFAKILGAKAVGTETTSFPVDGSESLREAAYMRLKDSVMRMAEVAEKENAIIGIEPVAGHTLNTPALARQLQKEVGSNKIKIIFDPVNMLLPSNIHRQEDIYKEFLEILGESITTLHVKDIVIENNEMVWRNIGSGVVDYRAIMEWLRKNKPDISLLREGVEIGSYSKDIAAMKELAGEG